MDAAPGNQHTDIDMSEAAPLPEHPPPTVPQPGMDTIPATPSHGGRFIQYNIFGNIFEITAKYNPPVMPIGKGAYGIVWYFSIKICPFKKEKILSFQKSAFAFCIS